MSKLVHICILSIVLLVAVTLSGCAGGNNGGNTGPGAATPAPTAVAAGSMPKTYSEISDFSYILKNLDYIRMNNTNYVGDQYYTMILTISKEPTNYKGKSCNHLMIKGNVTDVKGPDAIEASHALNFTMELYAALDNGNISKVFGGYYFASLLGEPTYMEIPEGDNSIDLATMMQKEMSAPMGEEWLFEVINSIPLNYTGTDVLTIDKKDYACHVLDLMMPPEKITSDEAIIVESRRINATSFEVTYDNGASEVISLVDDGMMRYWWYPGLARYPLKAEVNKDNMKYVIIVEEWR